MQSKDNNNQLKIKIMTNYKAVITEETSPQKGMVVGNTKTGKYKGMNKKELLEETQKMSCYTLGVFEM